MQTYIRESPVYIQMHQNLRWKLTSINTATKCF